MILLIDNYDSFTYNVFQELSRQGAKVKVVRNDAWSVKDISRFNPEAIVLSPGPGTPDEAGIVLETIATFAGKIPILGICLGHQAIGQAFGGQVVRARKLFHGKVSVIKHSNKGVFKGLPQDLSVTRYHSLVVESQQLPSCLEVTATTDDGLIMGLRHKRYFIEGVQFHPESFLTEQGDRMFGNFLAALGRRRSKS